MRYTLLELTQKILSSMDSDEVNSISDTTEAEQVVAIIKTCYYDLVAVGELPRDEDLFQLTPNGDLAKPVTMNMPSDVNDIRWLKYDYQTTSNPYPNFQPLEPLCLVDFIEMVTNFNPTDTNVTMYRYGVANVPLYCRNDIAPRYYTTPNDGVVLFDSYDNTVDSTLQGSKTLCFGQKDYPWTEVDSFVPPLDDKQSQRLLHEAKSLAFAELKQTAHAKAEKSARDIKIDQQASKHKILPNTYWNTTYDFGRQGAIGNLKPTGRYK
jgi:hypothetical protein